MYRGAVTAYVKGDLIGNSAALEQLGGWPNDVKDVHRLSDMVVVRDLSSIYLHCHHLPYSSSLFSYVHDTGFNIYYAVIYITRPFADQGCV